MRKFFCAVLILSTFNSFSQDLFRIRQIDSLVCAINLSDLPSLEDSVIQDIPAMGMSSKTYLTTIMSGKELKKFVNQPNMVMQGKNGKEQTTGYNIFYFHQNMLIKVEESMTTNGKPFSAHWYFWEERPLYYTFRSEKSESRVQMLLVMARGIIEKIQK